ncbi:hypothetical protein [Bradyrhizobium sp. JYMT SZCCT0180]|uniref:hypothetical protein n=1 Tax=Bradyrhizobium sp. JYMT SZCCT0180 TaxID=2807666 RepID=UPI001BA85B42|nr:hypothetical protein [Bradyrhizobium sp. JYMT SZCCT0180]MBR1215101.1 hypothetical protein [Bradyrhizobium sp. JYMT SZCCT0180]
MVGVRKLLRMGIWSLLVSVLLVNAIGITSANAHLQLGGQGPICIRVYELTEDRSFRTRDDFADRVGSSLQAKLRAFRPVRTVRAEPNCIKPDQPGYDRQLRMILTVKKLKIKIDGRDWNLIIAGGVSADGVFQDRETQPAIIVQQDTVSDVSIVDAIGDFVDRTIVAALRR